MGCGPREGSCVAGCLRYLCAYSPERLGVVGGTEVLRRVHCFLMWSSRAQEEGRQVVVFGGWKRAGQRDQVLTEVCVGAYSFCVACWGRGRQPSRLLSHSLHIIGECAPAAEVQRTGRSMARGASWSSCSGHPGHPQSSLSAQSSPSLAPLDHRANFLETAVGNVPFGHSAIQPSGGELEWCTSLESWGARKTSQQGGALFRGDWGAIGARHQDGPRLV